MAQYHRDRGIAGSQLSLDPSNPYATAASPSQLVPVIPGHAAGDVKHRYLNRFEDFKTRTLPNLRIKSIINIQRMARGWLARHRKFKHKAQEHIACVQIVDKMTNNIMEDKLIPDLLIQLFRQNELYQDVGLYSAENQSLYATRNSIMDQVLRAMTREVISSAITS